MWQEIDNSLYKKLEFDDFDQAAKFMNDVFDIARDLNHHPRIINVYSTVEIWLTTHSAGNKVTDKDKAFAQKIDEIISQKPVESDSKSTNSKAVKLYTDGGSRGNPGPAGIGYVIYSLEDSVVKKYGKYIGDTTNNFAEYTALLYGLEECQKIGVEKVRVFMDSELVVKQLSGQYRVKNVELKSIYEKVKMLSGAFEDITFSHVPRERNQVADGLVNKALDEAASE
jgi:ribonuclease HI/pterin-4a-carbinolamine dehydratase